MARVAPTFVPFAQHKLPAPQDVPFIENQQRTTAMLSRVLNLRTTVAFVGAGLSVPYGLPTWTEFAQKLLRETLKEIGLFNTARDYDDLSKRIEGYSQIVSGKGSVPTETLLVFIGECQKAYELLRPTEEQAFHQAVVDIIEKDRGARTGFKPIDALLDLPIHRFVTSNYDCLLEEHIGKKWGTKFEPRPDRNARKTFSTSGCARSFTQHPAYSAELGLFTLARVHETENMVFHCHGAVYEPDTIVASERDYQRWYLSRADNSDSYRQTLELLFGSNPILFIGFSLEDGDLLRQLRVLGAEQRQDQVTRPLFALLPDPEIPTDLDSDEDKTAAREAQNARQALLLRERYGVHALFFPRDPDKHHFGQELSKKLGEIKESWHDWWSNWLVKPKFRPVEVTSGERPYYHYEPQRDADKTLETVNFQSHFAGTELNSVIEQLLTRTRQANLPPPTPLPDGVARPTDTGNAADSAVVNTVVILGSSGAGKTWSVYNLLNSIYDTYKVRDEGARFRGYFYWSSYYANDPLTGIDRALEYMGSTVADPGTRFERLKECLQKPYVLVFDGFERLLQPAERSDIGDLYTESARRFLDALTHRENNSLVILVSQRWPSELGDPSQARLLGVESPSLPDPPVPDRRAAEPQVINVGSTRITISVNTLDPPLPVPANIRLLRLQPALDKAVVWFENWQSTPEAESLSELRAVLEGHIFGLALAQAMLQGSEEPFGSAAIRKLIFNLSQHWPDRRTDEMIRLAIDAADGALSQGGSGSVTGLTLAILERIAAFMSPVIVDEVWEICFTDARQKLVDLERRNTPAQPPSPDPVDRACPVHDALEHISSTHARQTLVGRALLQPLTTQVTAEAEPTHAVSVHPLIRNYIHRTVHQSIRADHPHFSLAGYSARTPGLDPGNEAAVKMVDGLIDAIRNAARKTPEASASTADVPTPDASTLTTETPDSDSSLQVDEPAMTEAATRDRPAELPSVTSVPGAEDVQTPTTPSALAPVPDADLRRRILARAAYSVVRARMELNSAARWTTYGEYVRRIAQLANLIKDATSASASWRFVGAQVPALAPLGRPAPAQDLDHDERVDHLIRRTSSEAPLYADELAWLYNELGLACFAEGSILDAIAVWEQGSDINREIETSQLGGIYRFQSALNLGAAYIQYGRLSRAESFLLEARRLAFRLNDIDSRGRVIGYLGLLYHLRGDIFRADEHYVESVDLLHSARNVRAESIFLKHRADLFITKRELDEARKLADQSRALGEVGAFSDLVAGARQSLGHVFREQQMKTEARREYDAALVITRRIGARRLESEVISELSRLALDDGDAKTARTHALESLRIANECALGLRQTHALVVLGRATIAAGNRDLGLAYLVHAKQLAERQGYWLRGHEAEAQVAEAQRQDLERP